MENSTAFLPRLGADTGSKNRDGYTNKNNRKTKKPNHEVKRTRKQIKLLKEAWAMTSILTEL